MPWFAYILECAGGRLYVGITANLAARFDRHLDGDAAAFTRKHPPIRMIFWEPHETEEAAVRRERQLKHWSPAKKLALAQGRLADLRALAKRHQPGRAPPDRNNATSPRLPGD
jgi:putative endonuclease